MTKASDNVFPKVTFVEGSAPSSPAATDFHLYFDSSDHLLKWKNSAGTVFPVTTGGFANPMTTAGDIIYGGASGTPTRLAGGTSAYVLTSNGATSAPSWQAAAGGGGGSAVLGATSYDSGSDSVWATRTSTTPADIDATNGSLAITVPASGKIVVQCAVDCTFTGGQDGAYLWLRSGSTNHQSSPIIVGNVIAGGIGALTFGAGRMSALFYVSGLTPGALTIKLGFSSIGASTIRVYAHDGTGASGHLAGPFVMVAWAA